MKVYVAVEDHPYDTAEVLGVAATPEGAQGIADKRAGERMGVSFGPWEGTPRHSLHRKGRYSSLYVEEYEVEE